MARIYALMSAAMKAAVIGKRIGASPCLSIELPVVPPADKYYLEREEFSRLRECAPTVKDQVFLELKVGTGMRWGEIVALHRHRVFTAQKRIDVVEVYDRATGERSSPTPRVGRNAESRSRTGCPDCWTSGSPTNHWCRAPRRTGRWAAVRTAAAPDSSCLTSGAAC